MRAAIAVLLLVAFVATTTTVFADTVTCGGTVLYTSTSPFASKEAVNNAASDRDCYINALVQVGYTVTSTSGTYCCWQKGTITTNQCYAGCPATPVKNDYYIYSATDADGSVCYAQCYSS